MDNFTSHYWTNLTKLVKGVNSSGSEASRVNDTWMALTDLVANESSNIAILFMKEIEDGNAASPNLLSGEKELFPELTENEGAAAAAAAGGAYLPLFAFEDVIEKTVERYGIINFLLILMVGTLLFSLALVAFILALATYFRCDENEDDDDSCSTSSLDEESIHYEDLEDGEQSAASSDIDAPEQKKQASQKCKNLALTTSNKPNKYKHLEDYLALESCYDIYDPAYVALESQNKPHTKPKNLPRLLNYARTPGYFYHNLGKKLLPFPRRKRTRGQNNRMQNQRL